MSEARYFEPTSVEEALHILAKYGRQAMPIAGGTDLLIDVTSRRINKRHLVGIADIEEMSFIEYAEDLRIGATTNMAQIGDSVIVREQCEMLAEAAGMIGSVQVRNLATIGGNICNALPCADTAPPLLAADAELLIANLNGGRRVSISDFILRPRKTILDIDELVVSFVLPSRPPWSGSVYMKHTYRKALDMSIVGMAVSIALEPGGEVIREARIALGNAAPVPMRATEAELALVGHPPSDELLEEVADLVVRASRVRDSAARASAEYRRAILRVLTRRCVHEAIRRART